MLEGRRLDGLHIVVDAANGAASALAEAVFADVGAKVTVINATPDGRNINDHCGATHLDPLSTAVVAIGADLGLALDGDADRLLVIDHNGVRSTVIHPGAHGADWLPRLLARDTVVTTVLANPGCAWRWRRRVASCRPSATATCSRRSTPTGSRSAVWQSGHVIFRSHASTGTACSRAGARRSQCSCRPLAELAGAMTRYPQVMIKIRVPNAPDPAAAADEIAAASATGRRRSRWCVPGHRTAGPPMVEALDDAIAITTAESLAAAVRHRWS